MHTARWNRIGLAALALFTAAVLLSASASPPRPQTTPPAAGGVLVLSLDSAQSKVRWKLGATMHAVHGNFTFKRGDIHCVPQTGEAGGEIVVDARSGESGNASRDNNMHKDVLESGRYAEVIFRPDHFAGKLLPAGASSVQLHGSFLLHGAEHELSVPVQAELSGDHWKGTAEFTVPYVQWGLKNPSRFLLKVNSSVTITLELAGAIRHSSIQ
jgi:hypothetical protein